MAADDAPTMQGELVLSADWRAWLVENTLRGAGRQRLCETLAAEGIDNELVQRELDAIEASPLLDSCRRLHRRAQRLAMLAELYRQLQRSDGEIDRLNSIDAETFHRDYYRHNLPAVVEGYARSWPALGSWSPAQLAARYGDVEIEVAHQRDHNRHADAQLDRHRTRTTLRRFVAEIGEKRTNDLYLVARNRLLQRPELSALFDDIELDAAIFDSARLPRDAAMWLGPAGTQIRLHFDTGAVFFVQLHGRKRFRMRSPFHGSVLLDGLHGFFYEGDPEPLPPSSELVLSPGDALYIPVGWFHEVEALDVSVSLGLQCFRRRNVYDWLRPGFADLVDRWSP